MEIYFESEVERVEIIPEYPENTPGIIRVLWCEFALTGTDGDFMSVSDIKHELELNRKKIETDDFYGNFDEELNDFMTKFDLINNEEYHTKEEMAEDIAKKFGISPDAVEIL